MPATIGSAYIQVIPTTKGITADLEKALSGADTNKIGSNIGSSLARGIKTTLKVGLAGLGTGLMASLKIGADLEQQLGGAEAVFGKYNKTLVKYSKTAFKDMGLSQTQYLQGANKIGSLIKASGIEGAEGVKYSNDMMKRASDTASVMGIRTEEALEAVTSAAKGNYAMMDNLGVKMNITSLNAYALSKGYDKTFSSMNEAQKAMIVQKMFMEQSAHAAGNYAKENDTLAGSLTSLKTDFSTLMGQLAMGQDISGIMKDMGDISTKFLAALKKSLKNISAQLPTLMNTLMPQMTAVINQIVPMAITILVPALAQIGSAIIAAIPHITTTIVAQIPTLAGAFVNSFATANIGGKAGMAIVASFAAYKLGTKLLPIVQSALGVVSKIKVPALPAAGGAGFAGFIKGLASGLTAFANPQVLLGAGLLAAAMVILSAGVWASVKIVSNALPDLATALAAFNPINGANLVVVGGGLVALGLGLAAITAGGVIDGIAKFLGLSGGFGSVLKSIVDPIVQLMPAITPENIQKFSLLGVGLGQLGLGFSKLKGAGTMTGVATSITSIDNAVRSTGGNYVAYSLAAAGLTTLAKGLNNLSKIKISAAPITSYITTVTTKIKTLNSFDWGGANAALKTRAQSLGRNVIQGIVVGINSEAYSLDIAIAAKINQMVAAAVKAADIHSPSKLFRDEVGYWIGAGIGVGAQQGIDAYMPNVIKDAQAKMSDFRLDLPEVFNQVKNNLGELELEEKDINFPNELIIADGDGIMMRVKPVIDEKIIRNNINKKII